MRNEWEAHGRRDGEILRESGADLILSPFADTAKEATDLMIGEGPSEINERSRYEERLDVEIP